MPVSIFALRRAPALLAGTMLFIAGCSTDPVAQPQPANETEAQATPRGASVPVSPTEPDDAAVAAPVAGPRLAVDAEGLRWFLQPSGSARPIPFGRPQGEVLASLEAVRGAAGKGTNQDCGAGSVQYASWPDGLSLVFQGGRFVGWGLDKRATDGIATAAGIGPGSTRAELEDAYSATVTRTSLGTEFTAGDLHGVFDGPSASARITDMWAGVSCVAR